MTHPSSHLAFDLGAESGRVMLGRLQNGRLEVREISRFPNGMLTILGHRHWNVFRLFENMKDSLRICVREAGAAPQSIGVDTWGVDFALLAKDGSIIGLPYAYRDRRTEGAMESFFRKMSPERIYELVGIQFLPLNTLFQLESMVRDLSPLLHVAEHLLFIPDLFHYMLTGIMKTEFTFATTSQLFNPLKMDWEDEIFAALGISKKIMQQVILPGTVLGPLNEETRHESGFPNVPVVAVATHDTGSAVAAAPGEGDDWAYISSGTWSLMGVESSKPILTEQARSANFTNEGGIGGAFRVLKNITGLWIVQQCRHAMPADQRKSYDELTATASGAPPFAALLDPDSPKFLNPLDMTAAIRDYCRGTGQRVPETEGELIRCILESIALKYRFVLEQLRQIHPHPINRIHIIGGGTKNRLLCQFTADATGLPVLAGPAEATSIGNLLVQAMAMSQINSLTELRAVVRQSFALDRYVPQNSEAWDRAFGRFLELQPI